MVAMKFTTKDRDNDKSPGNCALGRDGSGWWHSFCSHININHFRYKSQYSIVLNGKWHPLPFTEMKIKPTTCNV